MRGVVCDRCKKSCAPQRGEMMTPWGSEWAPPVGWISVRVWGHKPESTELAFAMVELCPACAGAVLSAVDGMFV